jgi:hypothetical protein
LQDIPSFTLNFDRCSRPDLPRTEENDTQQLMQIGYLLGENQPRTFEAAGVPVPRAGNATVTFNRRELGLYVLVEGVNKQFLKRYFKDVTGNVYDGHSGTDVSDDLPTNAGENPGEKSRLAALANAAQAPLETRLQSLEKTLT